MQTLLELEEDRSQAIKASNDILEKTVTEDDRALTGDEKTALTGLQRDLAKLEVDITERTLKDQMAATVNAQVATLQAKRTIAPSDPDNTGEVPRVEVVSHQKRYGKLRAFSGPDAEQRAFRTGKFIQAALFNNAQADRWCRNHGIDVRALSVGSNAAGGFLVPEEMNSTLINLREEYGVFRRECRVVPMTRDIQVIPRRAGGVTANFTGEGTAIATDDPSLSQVTLTAHKLACLTYISAELSEDAIIDIADFVTEEFALAFAFKEDTVGFNGAGTLAHGGIWGVAIKIADGNHGAGFVQVPTAASDTFAELTPEDLGAVIGTLPQYAVPGAKWFCSRMAKSMVFDRLAAAAGGNTMEIIAGAPRPAYLGHEVVTSQVLPAGASTDYTGLLMMLFGDLRKAAVFGDRREITIALSTEARFVEDQIAIKATERFDISVHDLGDDTTAGPIVAVVGGSG